MAVAPRRLSITRESAVDRWLAANPAPERYVPEGSTPCISCMGSGAVVTRYGGDEGCFPDEDDCPVCHGTGFIDHADRYGDPIQERCQRCEDRGELPVA